jgi:hypothetical protein
MKSLRKLLTRITNKLGRKLYDVYLFLLFLKRHLNKEYSRPSTAPCVWLDINGNSYVRYSYTLTKYFELQGYQVYMRPNASFLLSLGDNYARLILQENKTKFSAKKPENAVAAYSDRVKNQPGLKFISNDYFSSIYEKNESSYHIPIGSHPNMYRKGTWNTPLVPGKRTASIFFAGNFDELEYKRLEAENKFKMMDRVRIGTLIRSLPNCRFPKSAEELLGNQEAGKIDIVDKANFTVPSDTLRQTISGYYYFLACPGVAMPLSHNVYEAMSAGTIPIIHKSYATMFEPSLEHRVNAIFYDDDTLLEAVKEALEVPVELLQQMVINVNSYYTNHLTPEAIVRELISPKYKTCFLNAERRSTELFQVRP